MNFISAPHASLPGRESPGNSVSTNYQQISPSCSRLEQLITSALLQLTTYIEMGVNPRKPTDRTVCVVVDFSAAFASCHNRLQLPPATARWLSCYLRGRQAKTVTLVVQLLHRTHTRQKPT